MVAAVKKHSITEAVNMILYEEVDSIIQNNHAISNY